LNHIYKGKALEVLKTFTNECVDCVVTSPPYWSLRDYGVPGQLGLEPTFQEYVNKLCGIFSEVHRVLKKGGTCWVNMGDTYGGSWGNYGKRLGKQRQKECKRYERKGSLPQDFKPPTTNILKKSLTLIPQRFAIKMTDNGWILRNTIIWQKPNAMPQSAKDRFTNDFEYLYFFVKNRKYYFEQQFEPYTEPLKRWGGDTLEADKDIPIASPESYKWAYRERKLRPNPNGKNKRTVWNISTVSSPELHFATFPKELIRTPIKAGCPKGGIVLDPFLGSGTTAIVALEEDCNYIGIEINPEYIEIANKRLAKYREKYSLYEMMEEGSPSTK